MHPVFALLEGPDLLIVFVIVALLFGGAKLPKLARSLGSAKSEFEKGVREGSSGKPAEPEDERVTISKEEYEKLKRERENS